VMTEKEQKTLLERAIGGDAAAFEILVRKQKDTLFNFALSITSGNYAEAGDIMQEALIKAFLHLNRFDKRASFRTWLWRIAKNEFHNYRKSRKTSRPVYLEEVVTTANQVGECSEREMLEVERKKNLLKLIGMLPLKYKEIITLVELQELEYNEAAEIAEISVDSARTRLFRARKMLTKLAVKHRDLFI